MNVPGGSQLQIYSPLAAPGLKSRQVLAGRANEVKAFGRS
jgi:hypothetical protein